MWKKGVLAPEMAAPLLPTGQVLFSPLSLCACAAASDCIWIIYFYLPPLPSKPEPAGPCPEPPSERSLALAQCSPSLHLALPGCRGL